MKNINLIDILYNELSDNNEIDAENYERVAGKANRNLQEKVIKPLYKKDIKKASETDSIISAALERENRYFFELGFKCAMQLRNTCIRKRKE